MSRIHRIGKYKKSKIILPSELNPEQCGTAFAFTFQKVNTDESNPHFDVIIFANGNRVKDVSKDNEHPSEGRNYTKKIAKYFQNKNKNVLIEHILLDPDMPLELDSRVFANYIDYLASREEIDSINLIGHSKCGPVCFNLPKYFNNPKSYEKCSIVTTASPFIGCLIASPKFFLKDVKACIDGQLPKPLNELVYKALSNYYNGFTSHAHMDNDIAIPGYTSEQYDPEFIKRMFDLENIAAIKKIRYYHNFITGIDETSLLKSLKRGDFTSVGLCLLDQFFMNELTDGFIEVRSQEKINEYLDHPSSSVKSATHYFLSHEDELAIILDYINDKIDEFKEEKENRLKKVL